MPKFPKKPSTVETVHVTKVFNWQREQDTFMKLEMLDLLEVVKHQKDHLYEPNQPLVTLDDLDAIVSMQGRGTASLSNKLELIACGAYSFCNSCGKRLRRCYRARSFIFCISCVSKSKNREKEKSHA